MDNKVKRKRLWIWLALATGLLVAALLVGPGQEKEPIKLMMRDAVLHEENKINLFGLIRVNPALVSAFTVTGMLLFLALSVRLFLVPRMKRVPERVQLVIEEAVAFFEDLAKVNSPHRNRFLAVYIFVAGCYIFVGTCMELFGLQATSTGGVILALPAPLSDINGAISMGIMSYLIILSGGIVANGFGGIKKTLKEFSLPISMSFRLFGALLSGLLVTELVYYTISLSIVLPVLVAVLFTLLHALIQSYVLTMLTAVFYGEVTEPSEKENHTDNVPMEERL